MEININLMDKERAKEQVAKVQKSIDELLGVIDQQKIALKNSIKSSAQAEKTINEIVDVNTNLMASLRSIANLLAAKKDLWKGDDQMEELLKTLNVAVISDTFTKLRAHKNV